MKITYFILFLIIIPFLSLSQTKEKRANAISLDDEFRNSARITKDTVFYDSLYNKLKKRVFTKALYDLVFKRPKSGNSKQEVEETADIKDLQGKLINEIILKKIPPFGASVKDTVVNESLIKIAKIGNSTHVLTRNSVVLKNLFFEKGDRLNPIEIENNERLLRQLSFFVDAKILVKQDPNDEKGVIVTVITQDIFSLELTAAFSNFGKWSVTLAEKNMLGLAHAFSNRLLYNSSYNNPYGYRGRYQIFNIGGTFINSRLEYVNKHKERSIITELDKPFVSPEIKYGGNAEIKYLQLDENIYPFDPSFDSLTFRYHQEKFWIGRAFHTKYSLWKNNSQIIPSFGVKHRTYSERPIGIHADTLQFFHNYTQALVRLYLVKQNFTKNTLIYGFGRTEDVPHGYGAGFTVGKEYGEFRDRIYTSFDITTAFYSPNDGFLGLKISSGGFWNQHKFEQGILKVEASLFSKFTRISRALGLRNFIDLNYTLGINRFSHEKISSPDFVEAPISTDTYGTKRLDVSWETTIFTNKKYLSFNFSFFSFINAGMIGDHGDTFKRSNHFLGYGLGVRFANERLLFSAFQFSFGYYPVLPKDVRSNNVVFGLENVTRVTSSKYFRNEAPEVIKFE